MKLHFFAFLCFLVGSCQKNPAAPLSSVPKEDYNTKIAAALKEKSIPKLLELKTEIELLNCCDTLLALIYRRMGNVYNLLGQGDSAIIATKTALSILQKLPHAPSSDIAKCQLNVGIYFLYGEDLDSAEVYLKAALPLFEQTKDDFNVFNTQNQLLRLYVQREDYGQATLIEKTMQLYVNQQVLKDDILKDWHSNLGLLSLKLLKEDTSQVSQYKQKVIFYYGKVIEYLAEKQDSNEIAVIGINLGDAYIHCQELDSAQSVLNQSLITFKQTQDTLNEAKCLNNLAMCYNPQEPEKVKKTLLQADNLLRIFYKNKPNISRTEIYSNLGNLHFNKKEYLQAAKTYQQAIEQACSGNKDYVRQLNQQKVFNFNAPQQLLYPLQRKAEALFQQYLLDKNADYLLKSLKIYETLDDYITRTRGWMTADESKFAYSEKVRAVYENAMFVAMTAYRSNKRHADYILRFMAHSKAAVLQESVQQDTAKRWANVPKTVQDQEFALKWEIAKAQKGVSEHPANAYSVLLKAIQNWEYFVRALETKYPIYYHAKYAGLKVLKINTLQNYLSKDRMIIDYFWGQKTLYRATITHNYFEIDSISNTPALQQQIHEWVQALHADIINDPVKKVATEYSHVLYQKLLEKSFQKPFNPNNILRLTIIPDGILNRLPFEALTQKPIQLQTWLQKDTSAALIWKYALSYAYSNTLLFGTPPNDTNAPQDLVGFGINYNKKYVNETAEKKAGRLRHAEKEVINAKRLFPRSQIGTESAGNAHLDSFYRYAPHCRILYLSTHGFLDDSNPLKSGLVFVKKDSLQFLQLSDIQGLSLPYNDLTILSACNTGSGKLRNGEGLISLSRAFSFTGARSLLTTRWTLDDGAGSSIIESFLQYVKQGIPKDIALQTAKQDYLKTHQSDKLMPNYWAATVLVGDIERIQL